MRWGAWFRGPAEVASIRNVWDSWHADVPSGWRTSTGGVSTGGEFVAVVQRDDESQSLSILDDRLVIRTDLLCYELLPQRLGARSSFVQFLTGRSSDVDRMLSVLAGMQSQMPKHRPDVVRADLALVEDGFFVQTVFFTSEADARNAQDREFSGGFQALFAEAMRLVDDLEFIDVPDPWISWSASDR